MAHNNPEQDLNSTGPMDVTRLAPPAGSCIAVLGGCGGIGMALVAACLENGLEVAVMDLPQSLAERSFPDGVRQIPLDARNADQVQAAYRQLAQAWPHLDGLVNLAGYTGEFLPMDELPLEDIDDVWSGNLRATAMSCRCALPLLRAAPRGGAIVNTSSGLARAARPGYGPYSAAKAGIEALTRTLANENGPAVRVNAVSPGGSDTAFMRGGFGRGGREEGPPLRLKLDQYIPLVPLGRVGVPEDVAGPILFLLSDAARYISGAVL